MYPEFKDEMLARTPGSNSWPKSRFKTKAQISDTVVGCGLKAFKAFKNLFKLLLKDHIYVFYPNGHHCVLQGL